MFAVLSRRFGIEVARAQTRSIPRLSLWRYSSSRPLSADSSTPVTDDAAVLQPPTQDSISSKLRRALLYVPGNDQHKIDKAKQIADTVDSFVFDCEDGVAVNKKVLLVQLINFYNS